MKKAVNSISAVLVLLFFLVGLVALMGIGFSLVVDFFNLNNGLLFGKDCIDYLKLFGGALVLFGVFFFLEALSDEEEKS